MAAGVIATEVDLDALVRDGLASVTPHVARAAALARAAGLPELDAVELPPIAGSPDDARAVLELAPLYFVAELDAAGLLDAGERLAALARTGDLVINGPAAAVLHELWRTRFDRFNADERRSVFRRLFGADGSDLAGQVANDSFTTQLARLADAVIGPSAGQDVSSRVRLRSAAQALAATAGSRTTGVPRLASDSLLDHVRTTLGVVGAEPVLAALGARSTWDVVNRLTGIVPAAIARHIQRARAGGVLLSWLADWLPSGPDPDPVVTEAAFAWLEATLPEPSA